MLKTKMKGKILSLLTAFAMLAAVLPVLPAGVTAAAEETTVTYGAFTVTTDVSGGCSYSSNVLTISSGGEYTIAMVSDTSTSSDRIAVTASSAVTITLNSVQITSSSSTPFNINATGDVTIMLSGTNVLKSTSTSTGYAGLQKTSTSNTLTITSADGDGSTNGSLTATGSGTTYRGGAGIGGGTDGSGNNITINGGTVTAKSNDYGAGIGGGSNDYGNVTINGGTVTATGGRNGAGIGGGSRSYGNVTISGGYIKATPGSATYALGAGSAIGNGGEGSDSSVTITGGYFCDSDYTEGYGGTVYGCAVADGYYAGANSGDDSGTYPCVVSAPAFLVTGDDTDYSYDYVNSLLAIGDGTYTVAMNKTTYPDVTGTTADTIKVTASDAVTITLDDVNITSSSAAPLEVDADGNVTVKLSGTNTLTSNNYKYAGLQKTSDDNELIIASADGDGETTGTLTATSKNGDADTSAGSAGIGGGYDAPNGSNITIKGGTITARGSWEASGIGGAHGSDYGDGTNIKITGGDVTAYASDELNDIGGYGAGIGGARYSDGSDITIPGGTVRAYACGGAAIGGGYEGDGIDITITGGTVTAVGHNEECEISEGAGIGSGYYGGSSNITITDGTVTATGGIGSAGIGGGAYSGSSNITITGGCISAAAGDSSADAIGKGRSGSAGTITITGGYYACDYTDTATVYGCTVAAGYKVSEIEGDYPCYVSENVSSLAPEYCAANLPELDTTGTGLDETQPTTLYYFGKNGNAFYAVASGSGVWELVDTDASMGGTSLKAAWNTENAKGCTILDTVNGWTDTYFNSADKTAMKATDVSTDAMASGNYYDISSTYYETTTVEGAYLWPLSASQLVTSGWESGGTCNQSDGLT